MLYSELIAEIADRTNLKKTDAKAAVDTIVQIISECARNGEDVAVSGLGTFKTVDVPERLANNPHKPGEKITVPAHRALRLRVSTTMKTALTLPMAKAGGFSVR